MTTSGIKTILIGGLGSVLLGLFCTTFLAIETVLTVMPLFIVFNGLLTGYRLVEELKNRITAFGLTSFVIGLGSGAFVFSLVNLSGRLIENPFGLTFLDLFIYLVLSGIASVLGACLAVRYYNL